MRDLVAEFKIAEKRFRSGSGAKWSNFVRDKRTYSLREMHKRAEKDPKGASQKFKDMVKKQVAGLFILLLCFPCICRADVKDKIAVKCIMGEARGESYKGKLAIASALRNRGTTKGVYGCDAKFKEPEWVWEQSEKAWLESKKIDIVFGADHWGSTRVDKKWIARMDKTMIKTVKVGNHVFYKTKEMKK